MWLFLPKVLPENKLKIDFLSKADNVKEFKAKVSNVTLKGIMFTIPDVDLQIFISSKDVTKEGFKFNSQKLAYEKEGKILHVGASSMIQLSNLNNFSFPQVKIID